MKNNRLKLAKRIKHKGFFTQLPVINTEDYEYIILWRSVLDVSFCDLVKGKDFFLNIRTRDKEKEKQILEKNWNELVEWFSVDNYDFQCICGFSEFNPEIIYEIMKHCIDNAENIDGDEKWKNIIQNILKVKKNLKDLYQ